MQHTETNFRKRFAEKAATMKKPRNPIAGEFLPYNTKAQSSDKSNLLMPHYTAPNGRCRTAPLLGTRNVQPVTNPKQQVSAKYESCLAGIAQVDALRQRKKDLQEEMDHIRRVMEHKKICLAAGAYGGYGKLIETLHPALNQVTASDY